MEPFVGDVIQALLVSLLVSLLIGCCALLAGVQSLFAQSEPVMWDEDACSRADAAIAERQASLALDVEAAVHRANTRECLESLLVKAA